MAKIQFPAPVQNITALPLIRIRMRLEKSGIVVQLTPGAKTGFASPKRPDRIWVPPSSQMNRNRVLLSRRWSSWGRQLTAHLHLVSSLGMSSDIPSFTHTPSLHAVHRDDFTFTSLIIRAPWLSTQTAYCWGA